MTLYHSFYSVSKELSAAVDIQEIARCVEWIDDVEIAFDGDYRDEIRQLREDVQLAKDRISGDPVMNEFARHSRTIRKAVRPFDLTAAGSMVQLFSGKNRKHNTISELANTLYNQIHIRRCELIGMTADPDENDPTETGESFKTLFP